jgi:hypothetical protein
VVGFHARRGAEIAPLETCEVLVPEILAAREALAALTVLAASRKGEAKFMVTASETGLDVAVSGAKPLDAPGRARAAALAAEAGWARLSWEGEPVATLRPPVIRFGRTAVTPPPGGFLQATREGEAALLAAVRAAVGGERRIVNFFAGACTFALPLAEGANLRAVEADASHLAAIAAG